MSNKSERDILKSVGAHPHSNSGRGQFQKGDGSDDWFVIDVKEAERSFTLNQKVWNKICTDAYKVDHYKYPQLLVVLGGSQRLSIIETDVLLEMQKKIRDYEEEEWFRFN